METEEDAAVYSEVNQPQTHHGSRFIRELSLSQGDKVLDMGCGTGDVTKYITEIVGCAGCVVGVDPDEARIKIAKEKFTNVGNLEFHVGDSAIGFPHDNEPYYDAHISTSAFHWVNYEEKNIYIQKAHQCLKPGGKLAILGAFAEDVSVRGEMYNEYNWYPLSQEGYRKLLEKSGSFSNVEVKTFDLRGQFNSYEEMQHWLKASTHFENWNPEYIKEITTLEEDGSVLCLFPCVAATGNKI